MQVLHLEDDPADAELVSSLLNSNGIPCQIRRVMTKAGFESALESDRFDLIISDFTLPGFDGLSALGIAQERKMEIPFIFVSGTIGEEAAIDSLKRGATDYVLKDRLSRLAPAVRRAIADSRIRQENRRAENKIRQQAALLDRATDAICATDMAQRFLFWNQGAERIFGWTSEEMLGRSAAPHVFDRAPGGGCEALRELLRVNEWRGEMHKQRKDGSAIIVESRWTLLRDDSGVPTTILIIETDITEKTRIYANLLRTQRLQSVGALAAGVAHDINNVLTPMILVADLVREELATEDSRKMVDAARFAAQRGADMVKQILTFARGGDGESKILNIEALVREIVALAADTFPRSISIESSVETGLHSVLGDETQLHQVLLNLCLNARDAMPGGGHLRIDAEKAVLDAKKFRGSAEPVSGDFVALTVSDSGSGIPPDIMDQIFEPFFTTKAAGKGTGLGLATVSSIVSAHSGYIEAASEIGKGTMFRVYLPAASKKGSSQGAAKGTQDVAGRNETILVADDEAAVLEITRAALTAYNYRVLTARDGAEAIALFQKHAREIHAVVTDMAMPVMDGAMLVRELRRIQPALKIVCVSGLDSRSRVAEMAASSPSAFLAKPFTKEKLLFTLRDVLREPTRKGELVS